MNLSNNTILITGGATGIGLALAEAFLKEGNEVIICGRRESALKAAQAKFPNVQTRVADVNSSEGRKELAEWITTTFPNLNILVNNAGIQRTFFVKQPNIAEIFEEENEIETNLTAPIHLTFLLLPQFLKQESAAVINVSSGLGYVPMAMMPVYCATKAALQSFTLSLRQQLKDTKVSVFDIVPPIVDTDLDQGARDARGQTNKGIQPEQVAKEALQAMANNQLDIPVGMVKMLKVGSRLMPKRFFKMMNK